MESIHVKQIEDAMDTKSKQEVSGSKEFTAPQFFLSSNQNIAIQDGYLYWVNSIYTLDEEGNSRMSVQNGILVLEVYTQGEWTRPR